MSTIAEIIGSIRLILKEQSDDSLFTDQFLYNEISGITARLIAEKYSSDKEVSYVHWQTITLKLKREKYVDCGCVQVGCTILRSIETIPPVVVTYLKRPLIRVRLFSGELLPYVRPERQRTNRYSETMGDSPAYYIENNKIIIWNNIDFKAVIVEGVFTSPIDLSKYSICDSEGTSFDTPCYNIVNDAYPADADIIDTAKLMLLQRLLPSKNIQDDRTNDSEV
jgi:hypothetical protein